MYALLSCYNVYNFTPNCVYFQGSKLFIRGVSSSVWFCGGEHYKWPVSNTSEANKSTGFAENFKLTFTQKDVRT